MKRKEKDQGLHFIGDYEGKAVTGTKLILPYSPLRIFVPIGRTITRAKQGLTKRTKNGRNIK